MIAGRAVSLAVLAYLDIPPPELVEVAGMAGFDGVTLRLADVSNGAPAALVHDAALRRETAGRLVRYGLSVADVEVVRMGPELAVDRLAPVVETAAYLGARNVLVVNNDPWFERAVDCFGRICELAGDFGMRAALEFMAFTECADLGQATALVRACGHPAGAVLVDALHLWRSGGSPADVAAAVLSAPELFAYAQVCDAPLVGPVGGQTLREEAIGDRRNPGDGELPLRDLLAALPSVTPLVVEAPTRDDGRRPPAGRAARSMVAMRRLLSSEVSGQRGEESS